MAQVKARNWSVDAVFAAIAGTAGVVSGCLAVLSVLLVTLEPFRHSGDFRDVHGLAWVGIAVLLLFGLLMGVWGVRIWQALLRGDDVRFPD